MNKQTGHVTLQADGKDYTLRFGTNAIVALEEEFDMSMSDLGKKLGDNAWMTVRKIRTIMWCGMRSDNDDIDLETVGDIIDENGGISGVGDHIQAALKIAFPDAREPQNGGKPKRAKPKK